MQPVEACGQPEYDVVSPTVSLTAFADSVDDALEATGLPRTYDRAAAVTRIRVTHSNAS